MENDEKVFLLECIGVVIFLVFAVVLFGGVASAIEIIDNADVNPFRNTTNQTIEPTKNLTNQEIEKIVTDFVGNTTELDRTLIKELINLTQNNKEEKALLDALLKLTTKNQQDFTEAIEKMDYALKESNTQRDQAKTELNDYRSETKARLETYETEAETQRLEIAKLKGLTLFYVFMGLVFGVLAIEIANFLKDKQKAYFVIRKIREKIPIKF